MAPELYNFFSYWRSLGGGDQVPARRLLDLRRLTSVLRWMFIMEMGNDGSLRFRLAGSSLEEAIGIGMTDRNYSDLFDTQADGGLAQEVYALSIVCGCGLLRCGTISLDGVDYQDFEVLALPFVDERAMGGIVMVATVMPFHFENLGFTDNRNTTRIQIEDMFLIPSPSAIKPEQLSDRLHALLRLHDIDLRVLDIAGLLELNIEGVVAANGDLPSYTLESAARRISDVVN